MFKTQIKLLSAFILTTTLFIMLYIYYVYGYVCNIKLTTIIWHNHAMNVISTADQKLFSYSMESCNAML